MYLKGVCSSMPNINMLSFADKIKGQSVGSAYIRQINLVRNCLNDNYIIKINNFSLCDIMHYNTIDFKFFLRIPLSKLKGTSVAYVYFLPKTMDESIKLPFILKKIFYKYIIWFYKNVDHLVVVNPYFIDALKKYKINEDKITYIPNFVSESNFYNYEKQDINIYNIVFGYYLRGNTIKRFTKIISIVSKKNEIYEDYSEESWKCHKFYSEKYILNMWKKFYDKIYYMENKVTKSGLNEN